LIGVLSFVKFFKAFSASNMGGKARKRVKDLFSIGKREKELLRAINDMCKHR